MREKETFVNMKDVSSKNVSRKKKQAMFPQEFTQQVLHPSQRTLKKQQEVHGSSPQVGEAVERRALRAIRSPQLRRQRARRCSGLHIRVLGLLFSTC